ncbi:hypothetical protein MOQ_002225 [Trypanosoma cruzi marinkellei]|uniref:Uncharacterized protein n=1 Tax=Trypanosoma cruzi marinkellei TaxID=85056 RepID=K2P8H9_TRYCR|nr:hypothetical protein MOQ_002225 [Trypanosoma cruzi marinkellei]
MSTHRVWYISAMTLTPQHAVVVARRVTSSSRNSSGDVCVHMGMISLLSVLPPGCTTLGAETAWIISHRLYRSLVFSISMSSSKMNSSFFPEALVVLKSMQLGLATLQTITAGSSSSVASRLSGFGSGGQTVQFVSPLKRQRAPGFPLTHDASIFTRTKLSTSSTAAHKCEQKQHNSARNNTVHGTRRIIIRGSSSVADATELIHKRNGKKKKKGKREEKSGVQQYPLARAKMCACIHACIKMYSGLPSIYAVKLN